VQIKFGCGLDSRIYGIYSHIYPFNHPPIHYVFYLSTQIDVLNA
jgi:hypothetical protein